MLDPTLGAPKRCLGSDLGSPLPPTRLWLLDCAIDSVNRERKCSSRCWQLAMGSGLVNPAVPLSRACHRWRSRPATCGVMVRYAPTRYSALRSLEQRLAGAIGEVGEDVPVGVL